jgi:hypothetical protein
MVGWNETHVEATVVAIGLPPMFTHDEGLPHMRSEHSNHLKEVYKPPVFLLSHIHRSPFDVLWSRRDWGTAGLVLNGRGGKVGHRKGRIARHDEEGAGVRNDT